MADSIVQLGVDSLWHPMTQHKPFYETPPPHMVKGEGCTLTDHEGREYLDSLGGLWCVNVGYGRDELAEAAKQQMSELAYLAPTMSSRPAILLAHKLLQLTDIEGHVFFASSGSEANETAFKIAKQFHLQSGRTSRYKIIARHRAYHGSTLGAMSASGQSERKVGYDPMAPGFLHIPPPYPYRAHPKLTPEEHGEDVAKFLEDTIIYESPDSVAAFIMEPIISGGGVLVPPDNYLRRIREICDKYNVVLIFDEVVNGFGRTGKMFGHQHWGVKPDILTCAKGISSGYLPLAATIVNDNIFKTFLGESHELKHFRQINTYSGHPVATAVGLRNIEIIEHEDLTANARRVGAYLQNQLHSEIGSHPYVGEIRGKGLLIGIELVADEQSKAPLASDKVARVLSRAKEQGVIIGRNGTTVPGLANVLITAPPLVLTKAEADRIVGALTNGLASVL